MPVSLLAMWLLGAAVLALEARILRSSSQWTWSRARSTVPLAAEAARRRLAAWLRQPDNPLSAELDGEAGELDFRWYRGRGRGRATVEVLGDESSRVAVELDLGAAGDLRRRIAAILLVAVGIPLAVGLPLLVRLAVTRTGDPQHYFLLVFLIHLYWPLHPLVMIRGTMRRSRAVIEAAILNLPFLDDSP